jgi:hypothetical protein
MQDHNVVRTLGYCACKHGTLLCMGKQFFFLKIVNLG